MKLWITMGITIVALAIPATGAAGGGATFDFGSDYLVIGQTVTGRTEVWLERTTELEDGPFNAYLVPPRAQFLERGLPHGATWLAPISFDPRPGPYATATVSFQVPPVPPGDYSLLVCNDPCTDTVVGDLVGGWFSIAASPIEARVQALEDRLHWKVRAVRGEINRQTKQADGDLVDLGIRIDDLEQRLTVLRGELESRLRPVAEEGRFGWLGWAAGGAAAIALLGLVARRRRGPALHPPGPEAEWIVPDQEKATART